VRNTFINAIVDACKIIENIIIISGDAGLGVLDEFRNIYPDRFLNLGVAEQNMASFSAGLAMAGFKVYMYNIIPFILYRCYEQVRNDICYQELPIVLVGIGSGLTYAPAGMTHYSVEDIGIAQTLPNLSIISPIDPVEAKIAALYSLKAENPIYVRMAKSGEPRIHQKEDFDITAPQIIRDGSDVAILFHGSIAADVMAAYNNLVTQDIHPMMLSVPMLYPLNIDILFDILKKIKFVVSVEEHFINTGLGGILSRIYSEFHPPWKLKLMGIPFKFIYEVKNTTGMRANFNISHEGIEKKVKELLGR
jgi:transketolase